MTRTFTRRASAAAIVVMAAAFAVGGFALSPLAAASTALPATSPGKAGTFRIAFADPDRAVDEAHRHRVFILNADAHSRISLIKAKNPNAVVLVYKDLATVRNDMWNYDAATGRDAALLSTGVGYGFTERNHPEWFLTDVDGRRLEWNGFPSHWHVDIGNPTYQQTWLANVSSELEAKGWDGVFMDNANWRPTAYNNPGPAKYDTGQKMAAATRSMLAAVGPGLQAKGYLTIANVAEARLVPGLWADWISLVDGAMEEHFTNWSGSVGGPFVWDWAGDGWRAQVEQVAEATRQGKLVMARIGGVHGDHEAIRYGVASYLLANDGRSVISAPEFGPYAEYPELTWDLGTPTGAYRHLGNSLYRRDFTAGAVIVNASQQSMTGIPLGNTYLSHTGVAITSLSLGATRAAVLRLSSAATAVAPTTTTTVAPTTTTTVAPTTTTTVAPASGATAYVADATGTTVESRKNWRGMVTVRVVDSSGAPVSRATVAGTWTGARKGVSCVTSATGSCTVESDSLQRRVTSATLTLEQVQHATLVHDRTRDAVRSVTVTR